jgi:hypothetical protein
MRDVGERLPVRVVEVHREPLRTDTGCGERVDHGDDVAGSAGADGVTQRQLRGTHVEQPPARRDDLLDRHGAFPGVAEAHRHVRAHLQSFGQSARHDRLEHRVLLGRARS